MIDYTLRECPFCGNPAEIVEGEPFSFYPNFPTKRIRCSNEWCFMHEENPNLRYASDNDHTRFEWNRRRRKNKLTWLKQEAEDGRT